MLILVGPDFLSLVGLVCFSWSMIQAFPSMFFSSSSFSWLLQRMGEYFERLFFARCSASLSPSAFPDSISGNSSSRLFFEVSIFFYVFPDDASKFGDCLARRVGMLLSPFVFSRCVISGVVVLAESARSRIDRSWSAFLCLWQRQCLLLQRHWLPGPSLFRRFCQHREDGSSILIYFLRGEWEILP